MGDVMVLVDSEEEEMEEEEEDAAGGRRNARDRLWKHNRNWVAGAVGLMRGSPGRGAVIMGDHGAQLGEWI